MLFEIVVFIISIAAGSVAALAGFGIGSLLTPVFALQFPIKVAVAFVAIPHLLAAALRFWLLRAHVDRKLLLNFGITSALGGLAGAFLFGASDNPVLMIVFGGALLLTALFELTGLVRRVQLRGAAAWIAGALSGLLGGMVGNQGGIRSAAMLGFRTTRESFVATATAVALIVDGARLPVYLMKVGDDYADALILLAIACLGAVIGTLFGKNLLARIPDHLFRPAVATLILLLGLYMLGGGLSRIF